MADPKSAWTALTEHLRDREVLGSLEELVGWDQQTMMPPKGASMRGEQNALISRLAHEVVADPRVGEWLAVLEGRDDLDEVQQASVRVVRRLHDRAVKVPSALVERLARAQSAGFQSWVQAKSDDDFPAFAPHLEELVSLSLEKAQAIDASRHPYDVFLEDLDPGATVAELRATFARLRDGLSELLAAIDDRPSPPPLDAPFDLAAQRRLSDEIVAAIGFDLRAGRLDPAEHPFTVGMSPGDVRLTIHLHERDLLAGLGGAIHEAGHGMYEQGLPQSWPGTLVGHAPSFGLHESQSRFWENQIGRSLPFFRWMAPIAAKHLGLGAPDADTLYRAANRVEPSLIRVAADEVTYNLHIIVRFELELALFEGRLAVRDLPEAWNDRYEEYLGIRPPDDRQGVLQDVHWSGGSFAYFPSYTLGNLYGASFSKALQHDVPELWSHVERGEFAPVLDWLRQNVHSKGSLREAPDIIADVAGDRDMVADLLDHLWIRHGTLYGVER